MSLLSVQFYTDDSQTFCISKWKPLFQLWFRRKLWPHRWSLWPGQARYPHVALHAARPQLAVFALFARLSSAALGSFISRLTWWTCLRWTAAGRREHLGRLHNTVTNTNVFYCVFLVRHVLLQSNSKYADTYLKNQWGRTWNMSSLCWFTFSRFCSNFVVNENVLSEAERCQTGVDVDVYQLFMWN